MRLKIINETPKKYCTIFFYHCLEKIIVKFYKNKHAQQQKISDNFLKALTWLLRKICLFRRLKSSFILWSECHIKQKTKQNTFFRLLSKYSWINFLWMMCTADDDDACVVWWCHSGLRRGTLSARISHTSECWEIDCFTHPIFHSWLEFPLKTFSQKRSWHFNLSSMPSSAHI